MNKLKEYSAFFPAALALLSCVIFFFLLPDRVSLQLTTSADLGFSLLKAVYLGIVFVAEGVLGFAAHGAEPYERRRWSVTAYVLLLVHLGICIVNAVGIG